MRLLEVSDALSFHSSLYFRMGVLSIRQFDDRDTSSRLTKWRAITSSRGPGSCPTGYAWGRQCFSIILRNSGGSVTLSTHHRHVVVEGRADRGRARGPGNESQVVQAVSVAVETAADPLALDYQAEHLPVEPPSQVHPFHLDTSFGTRSHIAAETKQPTELTTNANAIEDGNLERERERAALYDELRAIEPSPRF